MEKDMREAIQAVKRKVSQEEWRQRIEECRSSGMPVGKWCRERGISAGSYYAHLREIREEILEEQQLVPVEAPDTIGCPNPMEAKMIRIETNEIRVELPDSVSSEQLQIVLLALKPC